MRCRLAIWSVSMEEPLFSLDEAAHHPRQALVWKMLARAEAVRQAKTPVTSTTATVTTATTRRAVIQSGRIR